MKTYTVTHIESDALNEYGLRELHDTIEATTLDEAVNIFMDLLPHNSNLITEYEDDTQVLLFLGTEKLDKDGNVLTADDITELEYATEKEYSDLLDDRTIRAVEHYFEVELKGDNNENI